MKSSPTSHIMGCLTLLSLITLGNLPHSIADEPGNIAQPTDPPTLTTTVRQTSGSVMSRLSDSDPWLDLQPGQSLPVGAEIRTGLRGSVTLDMGPNASLTVGKLTYMTIGQLELNPADNTLHTLVAITHGRVDFKVNHVGFNNDFRIASPTDVVAVKGSGGSFTCFDGPADITGEYTNGNNALHNNTHHSNTTSTLTGNQNIAADDRTPGQRWGTLTDSGRNLGGLGDHSAGNRDGHHGPAAGFDPARLANKRNYQQLFYGRDWRDILRKRLEDMNPPGHDHD